MAVFDLNQRSVVVTDRNVLPREYSRYQAASFHRPVSDHLAFVCDCVVTSHCRLQWREHSPVTLNYWRMVVLEPWHYTYRSAQCSSFTSQDTSVRHNVTPAGSTIDEVIRHDVLRSSYRFGDGNCAGLFFTSNLLVVVWQLRQWRDNSSWRWRV